MYGADPRLADLGTKTGCRRLFAECDVAHPLGAEDLHSLDEVTDAIGEMLSVRPSISQVIIKTNEGVSGTGNALIDLAGVVDLPDGERRSAIDARVRAMQLESPKVALDAYVAKFEQRRRHRRGADRRRGAAQSQCPAAGPPGRQRRTAVDP